MRNNSGLAQTAAPSGYAHRSLPRTLVMKWMDPLSVKCEKCAATDHYPVKELKNLSAFCNQCGKSFSEIGQNMRKEECRVSAYYQIITLLLDIEKKLKIGYSDEEIEPIEKLTIAKILKITETKIQDEAGVHDTVMEAVHAIFTDGGIAIDDNCELYQSFIDKLLLSANIIGIDADT